MSTLVEYKQRACDHHVDKRPFDESFAILRMQVIAISFMGITNYLRVFVGILQFPNPVAIKKPLTHVRTAITVLRSPLRFETRPFVLSGLRIPLCWIPLSLRISECEAAATFAGT